MIICVFAKFWGIKLMKCACAAITFVVILSEIRIEIQMHLGLCRIIITDDYSE